MYSLTVQLYSTKRFNCTVQNDLAVQLKLPVEVRLYS